MVVTISLLLLCSHRFAVNISLLVYHTLLCCLTWWGKVVGPYYILYQMALIHSINDQKVRATMSVILRWRLLFNDYYAVLRRNIHKSINITFPSSHVSNAPHVCDNSAVSHSHPQLSNIIRNYRRVAVRRLCVELNSLSYLTKLKTSSSARVRRRTHYPHTRTDTAITGAFAWALSATGGRVGDGVAAWPLRALHFPT